MERGHRVRARADAGPRRRAPWAIVTSYATGTPNGGYAQAFYDHLAGR